MKFLDFPTLLIGSASAFAACAAYAETAAPPGYAFEVVQENVPEPLNSEDESIEIYKRAAHALAMKWGIMFVYDDRCGPRVPGKVEAQRLADAGLPPVPEDSGAPAAKVFDDVYYVGLHDVASWAFVRKGGKEIYIFDALNSAKEAETYIVGGLRTLGFDPANIKAVYVMHGHTDHYGGAKYLQDTFGAKVMMGAGDWGSVLVAGQDPASDGFGLSPAFGDTIQAGPATLGDLEITFFETPGHTDGTISALIPVTFNGDQHLAAFWGGTGYPRGSDPQLQKYIASITAFSRAARGAGADVFMSNHAHTDASVARIEKIDFEAGHSDMIWGADYVTDLLDVLNLCARAQYERQTHPGWPY